MSTKNLIYAVLGAGDLAVQKVRNVQVEKSANQAIKDLTARFGGLVERGEETFTSIRNSAPSRKAAAQTKTAKSQTKSAVTSARKAAEATIEATKSAATNVG